MDKVAPAALGEFFFLFFVCLNRLSSSAPNQELAASLCLLGLGKRHFCIVMWKRLKSTLCLLLFLSGLVPSTLAEEEDSEDGCEIMDYILYTAAGAGVAAVGVPAVLASVGFTGGGIAAGSVAAWMMKIFAIAHGGGVPAGGVVATLQSWGAAASIKSLAFGGGTIGSFICDKKGKSKKKKETSE